MKSKRLGAIAAGCLSLVISCLAVSASPASAEDVYPLDGCPNLVQGDTGSCVQDLQYELDTYYGFSLAQDGQFGPLTESAVVAFQQKAGIGVDGQAGPQTQAALQNDSQPAGGNCLAVMRVAPNFSNGGLNDFGASLDLFIVDPVDYSGPACTGWLERSENGGPFTRISSIHTAPSNGGDSTTYAYWDGIGAKSRVCVDVGGAESCSNPF